MEPQEFIPCTPKWLEDDLLFVAAETAIEENPANAPSQANALILPPEHLAVLTSKWWGNKGVRLTVGFMESTPADLQARILSHMNAWGEFANVVFSLTQTSPQVRITRSGDGYWSYLGSDVLHIPSSEPTMCLQGFTMNTPESEYKRVVRHETGHTLGCPHEHMRPDIVNLIDPAKAIAYFRQTQGWSAQTVQQQVLTPLSESSLMGTPTADVTSIMTYQLPGSITKSGQPIPGGNDFAPQDRTFAARLYPKAIITPPDPPPPPPVVLTGEMALAMDFVAKAATIRLPAGWTVTKQP